MFSFDLRTQHWIPVRDAAGNLREISLYEALTNVANYLRIESESPLEVAALYRFLLAVLHRALKGPITPRDNARWFRQGFPVAAIDDYLERFADRFDLFHPKYPFYQIAEMPTEGYTQHWSRLSTEFGSGNTSPLFNYAKREAAPSNLNTWIRPAQAARLLLEHQTFCLGGLIRRFITSAPAAPTATAAHTLVQGDDLHQTLCLNLVSYSPQEYQADWVVWEAEPLSIAELKTDPSATPWGLVHRYTWLSRSVRLFPEDFAGEVGVCNIAYASAVRPKDFGFDATVAYRIPRNAKLGLLPLGLSKDRALWRDFTALLPTQKGETADKIPAVLNQAIGTLRELEGPRPKRGLVVEAYGQMSDQGKVETWRREAHRLPDAVLGHRDVRKTVENLLAQANEVWEYLNAATRILAAKMLSPGARNATSEDVSKLTQGFPARLWYWAGLDRRFWELLGQLGEEYDEEAVGRQWKEWLLEAASEAWDATVRGAGSSTRALKAAAQAQGMFYAQLNKLRPQEVVGGGA